MTADYKDAMRQLANAEAAETALRNFYANLRAMTRDMEAAQLTPPFAPRMFQVKSWRHKIPDLGQWLGRYIPGQPFGDGTDTIMEFDPLPYDRWALGHDPKDPTCEGMGDFAMQSFSQWREIGVSSPPKPFFQHLAGAFREVFGRIYVESVKVVNLIEYVNKWKPPG